MASISTGILSLPALWACEPRGCMYAVGENVIETAFPSKPEKGGGGVGNLG